MRFEYLVARRIGDKREMAVRRKVENLHWKGVLGIVPSTPNKPLEDWKRDSKFAKMQNGWFMPTAPYG